MFDISGITGPGSAFLAGMVTSLHCAGMCGPLACYLNPKPGSKASFASVATAYQLSRVFSYTLIGAIAGGLGMVALGWLSIYENSIARFMPWAVVLFFISVALRLDKWFPKPAFFSRLYLNVRGKFQSLSPITAGACTGFFTPLLPCGPLYAVFALALMTQSPVRGAEFLLAFAMGTLPLLYLVQAAFARWQMAIKPQSILRIQRITAGIIAIILGIRLFLFETGQNGLFCGQ